MIFIATTELLSIAKNVDGTDLDKLASLATRFGYITSAESNWKCVYQVNDIISIIIFIFFTSFSEQVSVTWKYH